MSYHIFTICIVFIHVKTLQQAKEGCIRVLSKLHFQSDELMFHPQTAEDCNWKIFAADQKYQVFHIFINLILNYTTSIAIMLAFIH